MDNLCGAKIKRVGQKSFWTRYIIIKVRNPLTTFKEREEEEEEDKEKEEEEEEEKETGGGGRCFPPPSPSPSSPPLTASRSFCFSSSCFLSRARKSVFETPSCKST